MANGPEITAACGLRRIQIFLVNSDGYPDGDQSGADGYDGTEVEACRSLNLSIPGVRRIAHVGSDRLKAQDFLPPTDGAGAEITTAYTNLTLDNVLTGINSVQVGETTMTGLLTDAQGNEKDICLIGYRQALKAGRGNTQTRVWQMHVFPIGRMVPKAGNPTEGGADENSYDFAASVAQAPPWGHAFAEGAGQEGYLEAQYLRFSSEYPAMVDAWVGDGTLTEFNLAWTPISVDKTAVFSNGVEATVSSVNTTTKTVTVSSPPAYLERVVAWYETSDDI